MSIQPDYSHATMPEATIPSRGRLRTFCSREDFENFINNGARDEYLFHESNVPIVQINDSGNPSVQDRSIIRCVYRACSWLFSCCSRNAAIFPENVVRAERIATMNLDRQPEVPFANYSS